MRKRRLLMAGIAAGALAIGTPVAALAMAGGNEPAPAPPNTSGQNATAPAPPAKGHSQNTPVPGHPPVVTAAPAPPVNQPLPPRGKPPVAGQAPAPIPGLPPANAPRPAPGRAPVNSPTPDRKSVV